MDWIPIIILVITNVAVIVAYYFKDREKDSEKNANLIDKTESELKDDLEDTKVGLKDDLGRVFSAISDRVKTKDCDKNIQTLKELFSKDYELLKKDISYICSTVKEMKVSIESRNGEHIKLVAQLQDILKNQKAEVT